MPYYLTEVIPGQSIEMVTYADTKAEVLAKGCDLLGDLKSVEEICDEAGVEWNTGGELIQMDTALEEAEEEGIIIVSDQIYYGRFGRNYKEHEGYLACDLLPNLEAWRKRYGDDAVICED